MPKKPPTAARRKPGTSPACYYKQYRVLQSPPLNLTRKQFYSQADSMKSLLLGTPVRTHISKVLAGAINVPEHSKADIELAKHILHKNGETRSNDVAVSSPTNHPARAKAIQAFNTPPEAYIKPSDLRRLSFWQKVRFFFNILFRKGSN
jgi:hypothetical protein